MSDAAPWERKLDAYAHLQREEGLPAGGVDVTVRVAGNDASMVRQVEGAGLKLYAQIGDILTGHVGDSAGLKHIAELSCVREVHVSRPMYADRPDARGDVTRE